MARIVPSESSMCRGYEIEAFFGGVKIMLSEKMEKGAGCLAAEASAKGRRARRVEKRSVPRITG